MCLRKEIFRGSRGLRLFSIFRFPYVNVRRTVLVRKKYSNSSGIRKYTLYIRRLVQSQATFTTATASNFSPTFKPTSTKRWFSPCVKSTFIRKHYLEWRISKSIKTCAVKEILISSRLSSYLTIRRKKSRPDIKPSSIFWLKLVD